MSVYLVRSSATAIPLPDESVQYANEYEFHGNALGMAVVSQTIGWRPGCRCKGQHGKTVPCVVLDPFAGSGTTGRVAVELNRQAILLDVAYGGDYDRLAAQRTTGVQRSLQGMV